jgi:hypothetical protein
MFRLKRKPVGGLGRQVVTGGAVECAASRCHEPAAVVDASGTFWKGSVPLCDRHWTERCAKDVPRDGDKPEESGNDDLEVSLCVRS